MTHLTDAQLLQLKERSTPGPWKAGYWYEICRISEHLGKHPGPPLCKYEPEFSELQDDDYNGALGVGSAEPGENVVSVEGEELVLTRHDAQLIAAAPSLLAEVLRLREALRKIGNEIGAPTMDYSPDTERRELKERVQRVSGIVLRALAGEE